jgi:beta-lactamase regulating signal transducer with metallopeptidase domain
MERLFLECTVRAALLVGAAAIVLYAMRVKAVAARHSVWAGVVALMLLLPVWTAWGPKVSIRALPPLAQSTANQAIAPSEIPSTGVATSAPISTRLAIFLGGYLLGLCLLLVRLAIGTYRARRLVRNAVLQDGMRISTLCAVPVTVGFLHPTVIFPNHWRQWSPAQLDAVLTHEREHARRRDSLVQWLALLNRALFWFHPIAWWLERHLSTLAEEACDNVVLARGHNPREYSEYLIDMARSVMRSGARLNIAGMAMPGGSLRRRIRQILAGGSVAHISRARMVCLVIACAITCTAFAAGKLDHAQKDSSGQPATTHPASAVQPVTKFALGDLKIEGEVHDRDGVRDRVLKLWKGRASDDGKDLAEEAVAGLRRDFQERGYFKVVVHDPVSQPLGLTDGKQFMLIIASITEGDQFRLKTLSIQGVVPGGALSIPSATLREQFHVRNGDLFNMTEIRAGLERLQRLYISRGYPDFSAEPDTEIDSVSHGIDLTLRVSEGPHTP